MALTREASGETNSIRGVQYEKGNKPENKGGKIFALCFMEQKVIELDCSTGSVRWLNWECEDKIRGKACKAGSIFSSVALPSGKI